MIYSNPEFFLLFFGFTLPFYFLIPFLVSGSHVKQCRFIVLLLSSAVFLLWSRFANTAIFCFVLLCSWLSMSASFHIPRLKSLFCFLGIVAIVLNLFFWKYMPWIVSTVRGYYPEFLAGRGFSWVLPIGVSFYSLQAISYLVDFKRGQIPYVNFIRFTLFKGFFAQLVAGPIVRGYQLLPQLKVLPSPTDVQLSAGLWLFVAGFFKKVAIADQMAAIVDPGFQNLAGADRWALVTLVLAYTVQIWADFSGYTDMGRGAAKMLGIDLPVNFLSPYLSRSMSEFWKRWHITLSEWIRDYIYIPLGGSKGGLVRSLVVLLTAMMISGIWHGASFTFLLWGAYHGVLLALERALRWTGLFNPGGLVKTVFSYVVVFVLVSFGWLIFRIESLSQLKTFFSIWGTTEFSSMPTYFAKVSLALGFCFAYQGLSFYSFESRKYIFKSVLDKLGPISKMNGLVLGIAAALLVVCTLYFRPTGLSEQFIYFQF